MHAPRHSLRSCPRRDLIGSAAPESYPLGCNHLSHEQARTTVSTCRTHLGDCVHVDSCGIVQPRRTSARKYIIHPGQRRRPDRRVSRASMECCSNMDRAGHAKRVNRCGGPRATIHADQRARSGRALRRSNCHCQCGHVRNSLLSIRRQFPMGLGPARSGAGRLLHDHEPCPLSGRLTPCVRLWSSALLRH